MYFSTSIMIGKFVTKLIQVSVQTCYKNIFIIYKVISIIIYM